MADIYFTTSAQRLAFPFKQRHVGMEVYDRQDTHSYLVIGVGSGSGVMSQLDGASGATDHGALTGLSDDDHTQYLLADGSRALGGNWSAGSHKITNLTNGSSAQDAAAFGQITATKLDDFAAPDDNTDLNVSTSKHGLHPKLNGDPLTFLNGAGNQVSPGIGGIQIWIPDAPPVSPHSKNDEFDGGSLDAKWTTWDKGSTGASFTVDTTRKMFKLVQPAGTGVRFCGVYQAVPASEFAFYAKVSMSCAVTTSNGAAIGIVVGDDLSVSTSDFRELDINGNTTTHQMSTRTWTAWNGTSSAVSNRTAITGYLRMRLNGTACSSDFSIDGIGWHQFAVVTLGFTPVHFGICGGTSDSGADVTGWVDFFRVFSGAGTSAYDATSIGRYL